MGIFSKVKKKKGKKGKKKKKKKKLKQMVLVSKCKINRGKK